jgi:predicted transposase YbfD/YdcC
MRSSHKKNICQTIKEQKGDYFFVVKDNQKNRRREIVHCFLNHRGAPLEDIYIGHGRVETRKLYVLEPPSHIDYWPECKGFCMMERTRYEKARKIESTEIVYAITSLEGKAENLEVLMKIWRDHWKIENQLHWVKDVELEEDRSIVRKDNSPRFFSCIRNIIVEIIGRENKSPKYLREELSRFPRRSLKVLTEN